MRLSTIKLAGFKSFVEPTAFILDADITGIVGPNGCGKSNVIDAVRWVTGESSARQLRGAALEDVIFNGSRGRKPVGRAMVELKFDNSDGRIGGQYARFNEIAVRRELTRESGSRYFINGARARRRDVVDLFLGTGLGGRSNYAIIEQGSINRLIEARPEDMRQILEEAAGISRYKERRRETENRIRHTRENLERLNDLIGEVSQRLAVLKRQARNAEKYKQLKQDERRLRAELLALRWQACDAEVAAARKQLDQHEQALAAAVSSQRQAHSERKLHDKAQQTAADSCQHYQAAFYEAQGEATRLAQALEHARRVQEMQQRERADLHQRQAQLDERTEADDEARAELARSMAQSEQQLKTLRQRHDSARKQVAAADAAVEQAEQQWTQLNQQDSPQTRLQAERTQQEYLAKRIEQTRARCDQRRAEAANLAAGTAAADLAALDARITELAAQVEQDSAQAEEHRAALQHLDQQQAALARERAAARTEQAELQARLASAKTMQQSVLREDDETVRDWLAEQGFDEARSVARAVQAPAQWQAAVEAALGDWLAGFAVDQLPAAGTNLPAWPQTSLMLLEAAAPERKTSAAELDGLPSLASRISAPPAIMALAAQIFVAADVATALAKRAALAPGQTIVTLDGARIGPATLVTPAAQSPAAGVLERERSIKALTAQSDTAATRWQDLQAQLQDLQQQHEHAQQQQQALEQTLATAHKQLARQRAEQQGLRERMQQQRQRADELAAELARLHQQLAQDEAEAEALAARIEDLAAQAKNHAQERAAAEQALAQARRQRSAVRTQFEHVEGKLRRSEQELAHTRSRHAGLAERLEEQRAARDEVTTRLAALAAGNTAEAAEAAPSEADHAAAQQRRQQAEAALRKSRQELKAAEQRGEAAARAVMQADNAVAEAREAMQQARIAVETASARRDGPREQLAEFGLEAPALLEQLAESASVAAWQAEIEAVERKIARLGAINLAAIEEYDSEAEREQYLSTQHQDLSDALSTLESAIAKIDRETRSRFKATHAKVNERFGALFPTLFGGGQAALELTEDELLSTGVRVMARPPGKRNTAIQMLSGGEKALTAVALLFALFELNPAPFCMLDEIDAPLDDANVTRFCALVRQMAEHVQFIVITHNKLTMELTQQLHGVTMAEPGVSRLVSVNIDQALDMAG